MSINRKQHKNIKIKVKINSEFEVNANPNLNDWNEASIDSKHIYVKEQVKEFLLN